MSDESARVSVSLPEPESSIQGIFQALSKHALNAWTLTYFSIWRGIGAADAACVGTI
jgi:hypothetical protein